MGGEVDDWTIIYPSRGDLGLIVCRRPLRCSCRGSLLVHNFAVEFVSTRFCSQPFTFCGPGFLALVACGTEVVRNRGTRRAQMSCTFGLKNFKKKRKK